MRKGAKPDKKSKQKTSSEKLTKAGKKGSSELKEAELDKASGGSFQWGVGRGISNS